MRFLIYALNFRRTQCDQIAKKIVYYDLRSKYLIQHHTTISIALYWWRNIFRFRLLFGIVSFSSFISCCHFISSYLMFPIYIIQDLYKQVYKYMQRTESTSNEKWIELCANWKQNCENETLNYSWIRLFMMYKKDKFQRNVIAINKIEMRQINHTWFYRILRPLLLFAKDIRSSQ